MSFVITIPGADFSANSIGTLLPSLPDGLPSGISVANLLLGSVTNSRVNLVNPEGDTGLWVGVPSFGENGASITAGSYFETSAAETDDITMMAVGYSASGGGNGANLISNGVAGVSGLLLVGNTDNQITLIYHVKTPGGSGEFNNTPALSKTAAFPSSSSMRVITSKIDSATRTATVTTHGSGGASQSGTYTSGKVRAISSAPLALGNGGVNTFAFVAFWPRALSPSEESAAYATIKTWLSNKGVSVI